MIMRNKLKWLSALAGTAVIAAACATTGVEVPVSIPAQSYAAAQLKTIAVLDFGGRDGASFSESLEAKLASAAFDGQRYFNIVNRQTLQARSGISGGSDKAIAAAVQYGASIGVDAVYFGDVTTVDVQKSSRSEEKTKCAEWDGPFDCERRQKYTTTCYDVKAVYSVVPKVVSVRSGQVVFSKTSTKTSTANYCREDTNQKSDGQLLGEAREKVLDDIRNAVAPRNELARVQLKEQAKFTELNDQAQFDGAVAFAKQGRMDRACGTFEFMADNYPNMQEVIFNQAVCAEISGDFERAFSMYSKLDSTLITPDKNISDALNRVKGQINAAQLTGNN